MTDGTRGGCTIAGIHEETDHYGGHVTVQVGVSDDGYPYYRCRNCGWGRVGRRPDHLDQPCPRRTIVSGMTDPQSIPVSSEHPLLNEALVRDVAARRGIDQRDLEATLCTVLRYLDTEGRPLLIDRMARAHFAQTYEGEWDTVPEHVRDWYRWGAEAVVADLVAPVERGDE